MLPLQMERTSGPTATPATAARSKYVDTDWKEPVVIKHVVTKESVNGMRNAAMAAVKVSLSERYSQFEEQADVLSRIEFIDVLSWPEDLRELHQFGVDDVKWLLNHFRTPLQHAGLNKCEADILGEFKELKMKYGPSSMKKKSSKWKKISKINM